MKALFSRRGLLAGFAGLPVVGSLFAAQVAPTAAAPGPHPDAALFAAEAALQAAQAASEAASARSAAARAAFRSTIGPCPPALILTDEERGFLERGPLHRPAYRRIRPRRAFVVSDGDETDMAQTWTADGLRIAIRSAVLAFGRGGRTPHHIRRWRELLPLAEAFDARWAEAEALHGVEDLAQLAQATRAEHAAAERQFHRIMALTPEGLAVKVRRMDAFGWMGMGAPWIALFQSAAAVSGVTLRGPRLDCERWASEFRTAGGRIQWDADADEVSLSWPHNHAMTESQRETLRRLHEEERCFGEEIRFWLSREGSA